MTNQELESLAVEFLDIWRSFNNSPDVKTSFQRLPRVQKFIDLGFIASRVNPREGEYALQHEYTGVAFFTGSGELVFTEQGLSFAKKCAEMYCQKDRARMNVIKIIAQYGC